MSLNSKGFCIPVVEMKKEDCRNLTISIENYGNLGEPEKVKAYYRDGDKVYIPLYYALQNGFKIKMVVLKVQVDAAIDEKTFEIPKGFDVKPQSTFEGQGGMRMIFRSGGN